MGDNEVTTDAQSDPYQVAYGALVRTAARTGLPKVKRSDVDAHTVVDALYHKGLLSHEAHLRVLTQGHFGDRRATCPTCGERVERIAVVKVAYTLEPCDCDAAPYVHLTEQLWHREHVGAATNPERRTDVVASIEQSPCPACGAPPGTLSIEVGFRAQPLGSFSLAGAQMKVSTRQVPVLCCSACGMRLEGQVDDDGSHVTFDPPSKRTNGQPEPEGEPA